MGRPHWEGRYPNELAIVGISCVSGTGTRGEGSKTKIVDVVEVSLQRTTWGGMANKEGMHK